ncbi:hypothetical protein B296_00023536 [Ensete ventricosum]|uniref:Saposin B-type domain-containing protein n=1 Tax=Ensete ventricosum TaxID=4639 RepID=A0A426ZB01_ENSVE|nr:hypothetical protein B296_00023536 [Ensete ventricosum]
MARLYQRILSSLFLLLLFITSSLPYFVASSKKPSPAVRKGDIPFIRCQVCEKIAHQIIHQVKNKEAQISPKKVSEFQIIEIAENICNLKKEEADWILQIDVVEKGDELELVEQGIEGQCNSECKTIEHACQEIMGYSDTDVAEYVFSARPSIDQLVKFLCKDLSKACSVKPPPVPTDRVPGEPFIAKSSKEAEMEKILKSMEGMPGAPGMKMYSREDLMSGKFGEADDDDDDDDEDNFSEKLTCFFVVQGNILNDKDTPKQDYKQKILQGISGTGTVIKEHINKVSKQIKNWWTGKTKGSSHPKAKKTDL